MSIVVVCYLKIYGTKFLGKWRGKEQDMAASGMKDRSVSGRRIDRKRRCDVRQERKECLKRHAREGGFCEKRCALFV